MKIDTILFKINTDAVNDNTDAVKINTDAVNDNTDAVNFEKLYVFLHTFSIFKTKNETLCLMQILK